MSINSITATGAPTPAAPKREDTSLGKDQFLSLLVAQLQNQDPMAPSDNFEYMGQLAQFSTLEQITNVASEVERLRESDQLAQSVALIGKTVGYVGDDEQPAQGVVSRVTVVDGAIQMTVGDKTVTPSQITNVS
jgi:flagellar basal-body rod modification protein FlgD